MPQSAGLRTSSCRLQPTWRQWSDSAPLAKTCTFFGLLSETTAPQFSGSVKLPTAAALRAAKVQPGASGPVTRVADAVARVTVAAVMCMGTIPLFRRSFAPASRGRGWRVGPSGVAPHPAAAGAMAAAAGGGGGVAQVVTRRQPPPLPPFWRPPPVRALSPGRQGGVVGAPAPALPPPRRKHLPWEARTPPWQSTTDGTPWTRGRGRWGRSGATQ